MANSVDPTVEEAVVDMAIDDYPAYGQLNVSNALKQQGITGILLEA